MRTPTPLEDKVADFLMCHGCLKRADAITCAGQLIAMTQDGMIPSEKRILILETELGNSLSLLGQVLEAVHPRLRDAVWDQIRKLAEVMGKP